MRTAPGTTPAMTVGQLIADRVPPVGPLDRVRERASHAHCLALSLQRALAGPRGAALSADVLDRLETHLGEAVALLTSAQDDALGIVRPPDTQ